MKNQLRNFIEILKLELNDLRDDIYALKEICEHKLKDGLITNYVHMENMALYENELHAIDSFRNILNEIDANSFEALDTLIRYLDENFISTMKSCGYAKAGHICIERKIMKVAKYVRGK